MYERELIVLPSEASCRGQIKLRSLINALQDTASIAVADLEGTPSELMARGYAWVLTRYEVEFMGPLPTLDERFLIRTFHDPSHGYGTFRVFEMINLKNPGTTFAWAKTSWLLLDLAVGRPVRPSAHIPEIMDRDTAHIDPDFRDIPGIADETESIDVPWKIRFHDLDVNGHVNNAAYFEWIFEATPLDLASWDIRSISASFRTSARSGDGIIIKVAEAETSEDGTRTFVYHILKDQESRESDGRPVKPMTAFMCSWEPRS